MRNNLFRFVVALLFTLIFALKAQAAYEPDGAIFSQLFDSEEGYLANAVSSLLVFFAIVSAGAVLVTGFFLGRRWLRRVG